MARVKPRSNVYALMPVLATLIMGVGIYFSVKRIQEYRATPSPSEAIKPDVPKYVPPNPPVAETPTDGDLPPIGGGEGEAGGAPDDAPSDAPDDAPLGDPDAEDAPE